MEMQRLWVLRGPNVWARCPVLEIELNLGDLKGSASDDIPGFTERLVSRLRTAGSCKRSTQASWPPSCTQPGIVASRPVEDA